MEERPFRVVGHEEYNEGDAARGSELIERTRERIRQEREKSSIIVPIVVFGSIFVVGAVCCSPSQAVISSHRAQRATVGRIPQF